MQIVVSGLGYVGMSNAVLLAQNHQVTATDISQERVDYVNEKRSPIIDQEIQKFLEKGDLRLTATSQPEEAYSKADFVIVATPTNYNPETNFFDTQSVESVVESVIQVNRHATIVIKSTIPVGFVRGLRDKFKTNRIIFSPEFLREGRALYDNLHPSRIIVGDQNEAAQQFASMLSEGAKIKNVPILLTGPDEAEAIKLFSNTYLAMRVSFFNELDSYALSSGYDAKQIIEGVCLDPRIGSGYNNPSFGYGGYCLPKDTKQLLANYGKIQQNLISAIIESNQTRKQRIVSEILNLRPTKIGIYRLTMKADSDNFRESAVFDVIQDLKSQKIDISIFEPLCPGREWNGIRLIESLEEFEEINDIIIANRTDKNTEKFGAKIFTRDIYGTD